MNEKINWVSKYFLYCVIIFVRCESANKKSCVIDTTRL